VGHVTGKADPLFAVEVSPGSSRLGENLAVNRRLTQEQKALVAAELRQNVTITERNAASRRARRVFIEGARSLHPLSLLVMLGRRLRRRNTVV
jgi:hypothetical protein